MREVRNCRFCGRQIFWDHSLNHKNLEAHEAVCLDQQREAEEARIRAISKGSRRYRRQQEKAAVKARSSGVGSVVAPSPGQLGFPFDGVPDEVVE